VRVHPAEYVQVRNTGSELLSAAGLERQRLRDTTPEGIGWSYFCTQLCCAEKIGHHDK
jgi:hypothetical protein